MDSNRRERRQRSRLANPFAACLLALVGFAACGDPSGSPADASVTSDANTPAVLVAERVFGTAGRSYFVSVQPGVPTAAVDRSKAREFSSADIEIYNGAVYIRDRDTNLMTRYRISDDLQLVEDGQISFMNKGLAPGRFHSAYLSPERAYVLDSNEWRLIEWNPTTMKLAPGADIPITFMQKPALPFGAIGPPARVGNRLVSPVYWADLDNLIMYPGSGAALVLDANNPTTPTFVEDSRVGGAFRVYGAPNGDTFVTGVVGGDVHMFGKALGGGPLPTSGILRIPAGGATFDPDYLVDIEAITRSPGIWAIHRVDDHTVLAQVLDPAAPRPADADAYASSTDFIYMLVDTQQKTAQRVESLAKGSIANAGEHIVDDHLYIQYTSVSGSGAFESVVNVVNPGGIQQAFTVPSGDLWHLQRVR